MHKDENGFEIFEDKGVIVTEKEMKSAKDVMKHKASLFDDDEEYQAQCREADRADLIDSARAFLGVKEVKSCYNCGWNDNGQCNVMTKFNQHLQLPTGDLEKCKHWRKQEN